MAVSPAVPVNPPVHQQTPSGKASGLDSELLKHQCDQLRLEQNLHNGIVAGIVASFVGAVLWALITVLTERQIGYMAVGVGFLVGYAIKHFGKGVTPQFGIVGALLALLGCLTGNLFSGIGFIAIELQMGYFETLSLMNFDIMITYMVDSFHVLDLLFYALAIYEGFRFSYTKLKA
jgi:hypothetical protein